MAVICPRGPRRVSVWIFNRDGLGGRLPDPASRKFQVVDTDGFNSPALAVQHSDEVAFRLGIPGNVMRDFHASTSVGQEWAAGQDLAVID